MIRTFLSLGLVFSSSWLWVSHTAEPKIAPEELPRVAPTEPEKALSTFQVRPGFGLELAAAEPLVADPIAMAFDENGRLYVVEMRDYSERRDERLGRIRLLEDTDADGRFDQSTVFSEDLPWPTAIVCYGGGVFVGATPDIWFLKDTNGDGIAEAREVVFSGFGEGVDRLNVQRLLNSFTWTLDNRIHGANGGNGGVIRSPKTPGAAPLELRGQDFSFDPRTFEIRAETGGGQYGMTFDDFGRKFVCSNSAHIQMLMYGISDLVQNPRYAMPSPLVNIAEDGPAAEVYRLSPDEPWRVVRTRWRVSGLVPGPIEGGGRPSGYFTGATGITIYRGHAWPKDFQGDAFTADCGSNLIHRKELHPDGPGFIARRAPDEQKQEFIASTDNWFRPVQFANGPDGCLYAADMYREVIEHPWSLPEPLKSHLDLNSGNDRGRIYRIVPEGFKRPKPARLGQATTLELVAYLEHPNGWHRDTASRLLHERRDASAVPLLERLARQSKSAQGRLHAFYALKGLRPLESEEIRRALNDGDSRVVEHGIRFWRDARKDGRTFPSELRKQLAQLAEDNHARVRYQLALAAGTLDPEDRRVLLARLAEQDYAERWTGAAILCGLGEGANYALLQGLVSRSKSSEAQVEALGGREFLTQLIRLIAAERKLGEIAQIAALLKNLSDQSEVFRLAQALADGLRAAKLATNELSAETQSTLRAIQREALDWAGRPSTPAEQRIPAIQLLAELPWSETAGIFPGLLAAKESASIQGAAVAVLAQMQDIEAWQALVANWAQLTPRARSQGLAALISRRPQIPVLLDAIEGNLIQRSELLPSQIDYLRSHPDAPLRERAAKLFAARKSDDREKAWEQYRPALELKGEPSRGKAVYQERCASCHRLAAEGFPVGPDLATISSGGREKLLIGILDPNREVAPSYVNYLIETRDGESLIGLIAADTGAHVTVRRAFGEDVTIARSEIRRVQSLSQSLMPEGLEAALTVQDMADLMEFIERGAVK